MDAFHRYLDTIEQHYRRDGTISKTLFAPESLRPLRLLSHEVYNHAADGLNA
jgi:hypothetical protein